MPMPWEEYAAASKPAGPAPWEEYGAVQQPEGGMLSRVLDYAKNDLKAAPGRAGSLLAGAIRGAGSIGATILAPYDIASDAMDGRGLSLDANRQRRAAMDAALQDFGADPNSIQYKTGKLGAEVAGTLGVGGATANAISRIPGAATAIPGLINAIRTGGMTTGATPGGSVLADLAVRSTGGAVNGALTAGAVDPQQAPTGAIIGGILPPAVSAAGAAGQFASDKIKDVARGLMQSAVKPTLPQLKSGDAATAIETMLQQGISPNARGVDKLQGLIDSADNRITQGIANSTATIDKASTLGPAMQTRTMFGKQVNPVQDLDAIDSAISGYLNHPTYPNMTLPIQDAQALKQGTYQVLAKKYGQMGSADTEAQKAIARGLKEQIAAAEPGVASANADLSNLLTTMDVAQRRALMAGNNNPLGLSALAPTKANLLAFLADRSTALKALAARGMYSASGAPASLLGNQTLLPYVRQGLLSPTLRPGLLANEANP